MSELQQGEKYLTVILAGHNPIAAFKNKDKKNPKEPDYKGNGLGIWINEKKGTDKGKIPEF